MLLWNSTMPSSEAPTPQAASNKESSPYENIAKLFRYTGASYINQQSEDMCILYSYWRYGSWGGGTL